MTIEGSEVDYSARPAARAEHIAVDPGFTPSCGRNDHVLAVPTPPQVASRPGQMHVDEPLGTHAQRRVGIVGPVEHLVRDVLGDIPRPPFNGVEGDDPRRTPVLPPKLCCGPSYRSRRQQCRSLERLTQVAEVLDDDVDRGVIFRIQSGQGTRLQKADHGILSTPYRQSESIFGTVCA
jgi:hypothetical protein